MGINFRQRAFITEYLVDFNGTKAAIRAGYAPKSAHDSAFQLLSNSEIMQAVEDKARERLSVAELSIAWVLHQWKQIAEADPSELIRVELECCHYCYGVDHNFQWTEPEYREQLYFSARHECGMRCKSPCRLAVPPNAAGGFGFDPRRPPLSDCPVCAGKGVERVKLAATRHVKGSARRLFAGVKQTKDGIEIKMRDQDAALQNISKYFGMAVDRLQVAKPGESFGSPVDLREIDPHDLTNEQLVQLIIQDAQLSALQTIEGVVS